MCTVRFACMGASDECEHVHVALRMYTCIACVGMCTFRRACMCASREREYLHALREYMCDARVSICTFRMCVA